MREALIVESSLPLGEERAEPGSEKWAQWLRLYSISVVDRAREMPEKFRTVHEMLVTHRAWVLLKKQDGTAFRTIEEFSAHPKPWGWGTPYEQLKPLLAIAASKAKVTTAAGLLPVEPDKAIQVATAPKLEDQGKSEKGRFMPKESDRTSCPIGPGERTDGRVQAILRAPESAVDLYRAGLVSQTVAAKLGPKTKDPEVKAQMQAVANAAEAVVKEHGAPKGEKDKRALQKKVDAVVLEKLGQKPPSDADKARKALAKLPAEERAEVACEAAGGPLARSFAPMPSPAEPSDADVTKRPRYRAALAACLYLTADEWRALRAEVDRNKGRK